MWKMTKQLFEKCYTYNVFYKHVLFTYYKNQTNILDNPEPGENLFYVNF